jgi:hypothetical protein
MVDIELQDGSMAKIKLVDSEDFINTHKVKTRQFTPTRERITPSGIYSELLITEANSRVQIHFKADPTADFLLVRQIFKDDLLLENNSPEGWYHYHANIWVYVNGSVDFNLECNLVPWIYSQMNSIQDVLGRYPIIRFRDYDLEGKEFLISLAKKYNDCDIFDVDHYIKCYKLEKLISRLEDIDIKTINILQLKRIEEILNEKNEVSDV